MGLSDGLLQRDRGRIAIQLEASVAAFPLLQVACKVSAGPIGGWSFGNYTYDYYTYD